MFERYNNGARRVVVLAQEEARLLNHNYIGTEHILLGLLHLDDEIAATTLKELGLSLEAARAKIEEIIGRGGNVPSGHVPLTPRAKRVLELSLRESLQLGDRKIRPEHILLGLIREGGGVGIQAIILMDIDPATVRTRIIEILAAAATNDETAD